MSAPLRTDLPRAEWDGRLKAAREGAPRFLGHEQAGKAGSEFACRYPRPGLLVRTLAYLLRPLIYEVIRDHPVVMPNQCTPYGLPTFSDAVRAENRFQGYGE